MNLESEAWMRYFACSTRWTTTGCPLVWAVATDITLGFLRYMQYNVFLTVSIWIMYALTFPRWVPQIQMSISTHWSGNLYITSDAMEPVLLSKNVVRANSLVSRCGGLFQAASAVLKGAPATTVYCEPNLWFKKKYSACLGHDHQTKSLFVKLIHIKKFFNCKLYITVV
jgi:hypothetical protein